ncbi:MAG TPA: hypothetical protein IAC71_08625 [Candidatus Caccomonas pullistercoris]|nr:hypothetical protein [Candidatus Caccomonas pullistercoris]
MKQPSHPSWKRVSLLNDAHLGSLPFKSPLSAQRLSTFLEGYHPKIHPKTDKKDGIHPHQPTKLAFSASKNTLSRFDNSQFYPKIA